jgi:hypothetical protein
VKRNITLLYGFSFLDQFMIVIALWIPYLTTQGIRMLLVPLILHETALREAEPRLL